MAAQSPRLTERPDIGLFFVPVPGDLGRIDARLAYGDLDPGYTLTTAILISLFSDRRAPVDLDLPDPTGSRRGYWADTFAEIEGDQMGSLLWTLVHRTQSAQTLEAARQYCIEALQWMIEDGVCQRYDVECEYPRLNWMAIGVTVHKPDQTLRYKFNYLWDQFSTSLIPDMDLTEPTEGLLTVEGDPFVTEGGDALILE